MSLKGVVAGEVSQVDLLGITIIPLFVACIGQILPSVDFVAVGVSRPSKRKIRSETNGFLAHFDRISLVQAISKSVPVQDGQTLRVVFAPRAEGVITVIVNQERDRTLTGVEVVSPTTSGLPVDKRAAEGDG